MQNYPFPHHQHGTRAFHSLRADCINSSDLATEAAHHEPMLGRGDKHHLELLRMLMGDAEFDSLYERMNVDLGLIVLLDNSVASTCV
ncbi:MAG: hypothetical protein INR62_03935 [Rhodospirillales bacterium]|nr:hypothetical protein [Acetobacter sp.]